MAIDVLPETDVDHESHHHYAPPIHQQIEAWVSHLGIDTSRPGTPNAPGTPAIPHT